MDEVSRGATAVVVESALMNRILRMLRAFESNTGNPLGSTSARQAQPGHNWLDVTGAATGGFYPATVKVYNANSNAFDSFGSIWLRGPTGKETYSVGEMVYGRLAGVKSSDKKSIYLAVSTDPCCPDLGAIGDCRCDCGCGGGGGGGGTGGGCQALCNSSQGKYSDFAGNLWNVQGSSLPGGGTSLLWCGPGSMPPNGPVMGNSILYTYPAGVGNWVAWDTGWMVLGQVPCGGPGSDETGTSICCWVIYPNSVPGGVPTSGGGTVGGVPTSGGGTSGGGTVINPPGYIGPPATGGGTNGWPTCPAGYYLGVDGNCHPYGSPDGGPVPLPKPYPGGYPTSGSGMALFLENPLSPATTFDQLSAPLGGYTVPTLSQVVGSNLAIATGVVTAATLTASVNDYAPGSCAVLIVTTDGSGPYNITGISMGQVDGQVLTIHNAHGTDTVKLKMNDAGSAATNRITNNPNGLVSDRSIGPGATVQLQYFSSRWQYLF